MKDRKKKEGEVQYMTGKSYMKATRKFFTWILLFAMICGMLPSAQSKAAKKVTISNKNLTMTVGELGALVVKNYKKKVKWSSNKKKVVSIKVRYKDNSCLIKAKKKGKATITAKAGKKKLKCKVTVKKRESDTGWTYTGTSSTTAKKTPKPTATPSTQPADGATPTATAPSPDSPTVQPSATPSKDENGRSVNDVKVLQKVIAEQKASGATVSEDLDSEQYSWSAEGNLTEVIWRGKSLSGNISFEEINSLTKLDASGNPALKTLNCGRNQLISVDVRGDLALEKFYCYDNQLTSVDVSENTMLEVLSCGGNPLTDLDIRNNRKVGYLYCNDARLTSLDVSMNPLKFLFCSGNQLTELDISRNHSLVSLECNNNKLTSLNLGQNEELVVLDCSYNQLTSLDVTSCIYMEKISGGMLVCDTGVIVTGCSEDFIKRV